MELVLLLFRAASLGIVASLIIRWIVDARRSHIHNHISWDSSFPDTIDFMSPDADESRPVNPLDRTFQDLQRLANEEVQRQMVAQWREESEMQIPPMPYGDYPTTAAAPNTARMDGTTLRPMTQEEAANQVWGNRMVRTPTAEMAELAASVREIQGIPSNDRPLRNRELLARDRRRSGSELVSGARRILGMDTGM